MERAVEADPQCSECQADYDQMKIYWDSLSSVQLKHRARMQSVQHQLHQTTRIHGLSVLCSASPCPCVFSNEKEEKNHYTTGKRCPRREYLNQEFPETFRATKTRRVTLSSVSELFGLPKPTEKVSSDFLWQPPPIHQQSVGLEKDDLMARYSKFPSRELSDEVNRRIQLCTDLSIFTVPAKTKSAMVCQLVLHDLAVEQIRFIQQKELDSTRYQQVDKDRESVLGELNQLCQKVQASTKKKRASQRKRKSRLSAVSSPSSALNSPSYSLLSPLGSPLFSDDDFP